MNTEMLEVEEDFDIPDLFDAEEEDEDTQPDDLLNNSLDNLFYQSGNRRLLSPEQEKDLARKAHAGDEKSRHIMAESNLKLVFSIVKLYLRSGMSLPDLVQEGCIGLMTAIDNFNPDLNLRFSTYATWWIRQAISRAIEDKNRVVRLPSHLFQEYRDVCHLYLGFLADNGVPPTLGKLAQIVGKSEEKVIYLFDLMKDTLSLDEHIKSSSKENITLGETLVDKVDRDPMNTGIISREESDILRSLVEKLPPYEREIIKDRMGFNSEGEPKTLEQIGYRFHVSRERIRQVEARALKIMRKLLNTNHTQDYFLEK